VCDQGNRPTPQPIDGWPRHQRLDRPFDGTVQDFPDDPIKPLFSGPDLHTISHDLKNRLTLIKGWAGRLQRRVEAELDRPAILQGSRPSARLLRPWMSYSARFSTRADQTSGIGIGLFAARTLADQHGG
jgi:hypothetical protein